MGTKTQKQGSHKPYGPKMSNPRISRPKAKRQCGPLGYALRFRDAGRRFTTRAAALR